MEHSGNLFTPHLTAQTTPIRLFTGYSIAIGIPYRQILVNEFQQLGCAGLLDGCSLASEELGQFSEIICLLGQMLLFAATGQIGADDAHFHGREFLIHMGLFKDLLGRCFFFFWFESVFACITDRTLPSGR